MAQEVGLPASFTTETDLPLEVLGAVRFEDQAQFHARKYGLALAEAFVGAGGRIYEQSRVVAVDTSEGRCTVESGGTVEAEHLVLATQLPILDRGGFFAKTHPSRTYLMAFETERAPLEGMYIGKGGSSWTLRSAEKGRYLIAGGQAHKTGQEPDTPARYAAIERWTREHFERPGGLPLERPGLRARRRPPVRRGAPVRERAGVGRHGLPEVGAHERDRRGLDDREGSPGGPTRGPRRSTRTAWTSRRLPRSSSRRTSTWPRASSATGSTTSRARRPRRSRPARAPSSRPARARRGVPRRGRPAPRRLPDVHPPRLPRHLEPRRALVGLPLPRLPLRRGRRGAPRPGRPPAGAEGARRRCSECLSPCPPPVLRYWTSPPRADGALPGRPLQRHGPPPPPRLAAPRDRPRGRAGLGPGGPRRHRTWAGPRHGLSSGRTFDYEETIRLTTGNRLWSNRSEPVPTIVEDTCGVHDFLLTPCSPEMYTLLYDFPSDHDHPSGLPNLAGTSVRSGWAATAFRPRSTSS